MSGPLSWPFPCGNAWLEGRVTVHRLCCVPVNYEFRVCKIFPFTTTRITRTTRGLGTSSAGPITRLIPANLIGITPSAPLCWQRAVLERPRQQPPAMQHGPQQLSPLQPQQVPGLEQHVCVSQRSPLYPLVHPQFPCGTTHVPPTPQSTCPPTKQHP